MGMSADVEAFRPADDKWREMKAIWDACKKAGVQVPEAVTDFFNDEAPDEAGVRISLYGEDEIVEKYDGGRERCEDGLQVDLDKLLAKYPGVKYLRFVNYY